MPSFWHMELPLLHTTTENPICTFSKVHLVLRTESMADGDRTDCINWSTAKLGNRTIS